MTKAQSREGATDHRILIVDDDEATVSLLERVLESAGYEAVRSTTDARKALPMFREVQPDLVLLDVRMPFLDGVAVLNQLRVRIPEGEYVPLVMITGDPDPAVRQQALAAGATHVLAKPLEPQEVVLLVRNLLATRDLNLQLDRQVRDRTEGLKRAEIEIAHRLALAAELRDYGSVEHTLRVGHMSALIAEQVGLPDGEVEAIRHAAPLHDIGKIAIPDAILLKRGALSLDEFEVMKTHTSFGARILAGSVSPVLRLAEEIALYHHENWDGTGYTPGLAGESIPLVGRIVAIADTYDALISERPYKKAWSTTDAVEFIYESGGSKFDPEVVDAFRKVHTVQELPLLEEVELALPSLDIWPNAEPATSGSSGADSMPSGS